MTLPLIQVENLRKTFTVGQSGLFKGEQQLIRAVDDVSFTLERGEIMALVGESGCGKSTLALTLLGLEKPSEGRILFDGQDMTSLNRSSTKTMRRQIQMIFQDPYESLNPTMSIGRIVAEPLLIHRLASNRDEKTRLVEAALESAGLKPASTFINRYPHELSGGQRQRVVIAAALILNPLVLLADEPVSMLDVSIRAEILNLLSDLSRERGISVLYVTHDLSTVAYIAKRIAVMYLGRIVEMGATQDILDNPKHPYTRALLSVVPAPNPRLRTQRTILTGETPNPTDLPPYCRFYSRCPAAIKPCLEVDPRLEMISEHHAVACINSDDLG